MPFVTVRNLRIYYESRGGGQRVLGIGGTGGDLRRFPTIFDMLPAQGFEILAFFEGGRLFFAQNPRAVPRIGAFLRGEPGD